MKISTENVLKAFAITAIAVVGGWIGKNDASTVEADLFNKNAKQTQVTSVVSPAIQMASQHTVAKNNKPKTH